MSTDFMDVVSAMYYPKQMAKLAAEPVVLVSFEDGHAVHIIEEMSREQAEETLETLERDAANTQPGRRIRICTLSERDTLLRVSKTARAAADAQAQQFVRGHQPRPAYPSPEFPLDEYEDRAELDPQICIRTAELGKGTVVVAPDGKGWRAASYNRSRVLVKTVWLPYRAQAETLAEDMLRSLANPAARSFRQSSKHGF